MDTICEAQCRLASQRSYNQTVVVHARRRRNLEDGMSIKSARPGLAAAILLSGLWIPAAFAYTGGHGGGGSSGHSSGGHFSGGGHYAGGHAYAARPYAGHAYAPHAFVGTRAAYVGAGRGGAAVGGIGHGAVAVGAGVRGRAVGPGYGHWSHWGGGYWGGRYWPAAYYGPGFAWFLPALPLYCATYWFNSVPYYYYNDVYYTWSPAADGYVATDPPPAAGSGPSAPASAPDGSSDGAAPSGGAYGDAGAPAPSGAPSDAEAIPPGQFAAGSGSGENVYAYPTNGQSEQQQAADRAECDRWAATQAGSASGSPDYRRAVIACFQGRGYSAQ
jgi:hypothetical protein